MIKKLRNHKEFTKYFKNTSWMMAEQVLRIFAGLFVGVWVARYLEPEQFGIYSYILAFTSIFAGIAKLGLDDIVIRELVNNSKRKYEYLGTAFWLKLFGAILSIILISLILPFTENNTEIVIYIYIITIGLLFQSFEVIEFYFYSKVLGKNISICKTIQLIFSSFLKIYFVLTDLHLLYFVILASVDIVVISLLYIFVFYKIEGVNFIKNFNSVIAKKYLNDSWPLILTVVVMAIYMRIDQIMIKEMLGSYQVGVYSAAVRISEAIYFIPVIINASIYPAIINIRKKSEAIYNLRLQKLYTIMFLLALFISLPVTFYSEHLILLLYGDAYKNASFVLMIHVWAAVFVFIGVSFSKYLLTENLAKISFYRSLLGAIVNVFLNLILIPVYGVVGAAIATLIAQCVANIGYDILDKRLHNQFRIKLKAIVMPWDAFRN